MQQAAKPLSAGDFIHNRHHDLALNEAEEPESVTSESTCFEGATSDMTKPVFESSESQHDQIAIRKITSRDYHRGTLIPNQSCTLHVQGVEDVEGAMTPTSRQHHNSDNSNEFSAQVQEYQVKLNQDIEVCHVV